jgi:hypothetical protein
MTIYGRTGKIRMSLAWKSFHSAMYALTSADPQRERLLRAYRLHLSRLTPREVPQEIRDDFTALATAITRRPAATGECRIKNTIDAAEDREIVSMINAIIKMYDAVTRYQPLLHEAGQSDHPVAAAASPRRA